MFLFKGKLTTQRPGKKKQKKQSCLAQEFGMGDLENPFQYSSLGLRTFFCLENMQKLEKLH